MSFNWKENRKKIEKKIRLLMLCFVVITRVKWDMFGAKVLGFFIGTKCGCNRTPQSDLKGSNKSCLADKQVVITAAFFMLKWGNTTSYS